MLEKAGTSFSCACFVQVFLSNIAFVDDFERVYSKFLASHNISKGAFPARTCYAVKALPKGALVEIEAVAAMPTSKLSFIDGCGAQQCSKAAICNDLVFTDGHLASSNHANAEDATKEVLENLAFTLEAAGSSLSHVLKVTVLLSSMSDYSDCNRAYKKFFPNNPPARAAFGVGALQNGALVQIFCTAVKLHVSPRALAGKGLVPVYSPAVEIPGIVFTSGQIALDPTCKEKRLVGRGDIAAEFAQALRNLSRVLSESGSSFTRCVKCSIFLKSIADFGIVNKAYAEAFAGCDNMPARAVVQVATLPADALVEIEAVALR